MKKIVNTTEKIMNWWAKITSLVMVFGVFYSIHIVFSFVELYMESQALGLNSITLSSTIFFVLTMVFSVILSLIFYSPFFYYGWVKNPNNKNMKSLTKVTTIIYSICVVFGPIFTISKFLDILAIPIALVLIAPLYYYAWKK